MGLVVEMTQLSDKMIGALHNFNITNPPASKETIMSSTPSDLYFAQAFHHGEPEHHSYVVAIGHKERVETLARAEHARQEGEYGIAVYLVELDAPMQEHLHLVNYFGSNMGERWIDGQRTSRQAA